MSYNTRIELARNKAYDFAIGNKILDLMDKLRMDQNNSSARRWIWELLQNAKDVAYENQPVSIEIDYVNDTANAFVEFKHTGKPFSIDNITFLIEQISTKDRKSAPGVKPKSTGKFGTGFLTTHLLSEKVDVRGCIKEADLEYCKFDIHLDRSGRDVETLINSINSSLAALQSLDSSSYIKSYDKEQYNTSFKYTLDANGIQVAEQGLADVKYSLPYVLVFLPEIKQVHFNHTKTTFEVSPTNKTLHEGVMLHTIRITQETDFSLIKIVTIRTNACTLAVEVFEEDEKIYLKPFHRQTPKLFCDFPLIGSEDFHFPLVINSSNFNPNEPRSGIWLTDRTEDKVIENKSIVLEALKLYSDLLDCASLSDWRNCYVLAKTSPLAPKEWISTNWFESEILTTIRNKILHTAIVDLEIGKKETMLSSEGKGKVYFPDSTLPNVRRKIWELSFKLFPGNMPRASEVDLWYEILWPECYHQSLKELTKDVASRGNVSKLSETLRQDEEGAIVWLNEYYELLNIEQIFINEVVNGNFAVIPNQNNQFVKLGDLFRDEAIDEEIKNILKLLGKDIRSVLKHKKIVTEGIGFPDDKRVQISYKTKRQEDLIDEINKILKENKNPNIVSACNHLVTLFPEDEMLRESREPMFDFCKTLFPNDISEKKILNNYNEDIWDEADKILLKRCVLFVSSKGNLDDLREQLSFADLEMTIAWVSRFVDYLIQNEFESLLNLKTAPILPNQKKAFHIQDDLFLDDGSIGNDLKDIIADLGYDVREVLLDEHIAIGLPDSRVKGIVNVAAEIQNRIPNRFTEIPRSAATKTLFRKLYLWFSSHKDVARVVFGDLFLNKHRLFDDEEIVVSIEKAEQVSELMTEFGIKDIDNLRRILVKYGQGLTEVKPKPVTRESLVSLAVTNKEEFDAAFHDRNVSSRFQHTSTPTPEMYQYAQNLISRAKTNIINYLKSLSEYNCEELEETAPTVLAGIKKHDIPIFVVTRPSDNGEVIIHSKSETDSLDYVNAELWIDNGNDLPRHLTLGRVLKTTGINRIPL